MAEKIFLRDVGSRPERDLEVTLFPDGELQFEVHQLMYVHINISRDGVEELLGLLLETDTKENRMMIALKTRVGGETFYLNVDLIESIIEREGNTSEIRLTNGAVYLSIESPRQIANRVSFAKMSSELSKPK